MLRPNDGIGWPRPQGFRGGRHYGERTRKGFSEVLCSVLRDKMPPERESHGNWQPRGSRMRPTRVWGGAQGGGPQCGLLMQLHRAGITGWRLWEWRGKASRHIWLESQRRAGGLPGLSPEEGFSQEAQTLLKASSDPFTSFNPQGKEEHSPPPGMASRDPGHTEVREGKGNPRRLRRPRASSHWPNSALSCYSS